MGPSHFKNMITYLLESVSFVELHNGLRAIYNLPVRSSAAILSVNRSPAHMQGPAASSPFNNIMPRLEDSEENTGIPFQALGSLNGRRSN